MQARLARRAAVLGAALALSLALGACAEKDTTALPDGAVGVDAGDPPVDAGSGAPDLGPGIDAGAIADAGAAPDADPSEDASVDAGAEPDAGAADDAAVPDAADAGPAPDAAPAPDGGAVPDAGIAVDAGTPAGPDPSAVGPFSTSSLDARVTRGRRTTPVTAHLPMRTDGRRSPVVVLLPGFQLDTDRYVALAEHLASHGVAVVRADPPSSLRDVDHVEMAADVGAVLDWIADPNGRVAATVDTARMGAVGHSLGGKIATMAAFRDTRIRALLGLDPVNGGGPTGYAPTRPDIVPDEVTPLTIPVGFMGETTNGMGGGLSPACAPLDQNFTTFYDAATMAPAALEWDFAGADHMDFVFDESFCLACRACPEGPADEATVRAAITTLATAFFRRHLDAESGMDAWLRGPRLPAGVTVRARP